MPYLRCSHEKSKSTIKSDNDSVYLFHCYVADVDTISISHCHINTSFFIIRFLFNLSYSPLRFANPFLRNAKIVDGFGHL